MQVEWCEYFYGFLQANKIYMKLPIVAYGDPVLRRETIEIDEDYPALDELVENMFDTMYGAKGVGLAAPQIGLAIRLFIVDATPFSEDDEDEVGDPSLKEFKKVFINPIIIDELGEEWGYFEGCLSIPEISEEVFRRPTIRINYLDQDFNEIEETYTGMAARIIQHEYDHIEGKLFVDHLAPLKKVMLKGKLDAISKGKVPTRYRMRFPNLKKKR